jgi:hypothetical protein
MLDARQKSLCARTSVLQQFSLRAGQPPSSKGSGSNATIQREQIAETERLIRPHIRRTPIIEADGADFGLDAVHS